MSSSLPPLKVERRLFRNMHSDSSGRGNLVDFLSLGTFAGYLVNLLPTLALIFTVIWSLFRILEMQTTHALFYRLFKVRLDQWLVLPSNILKDKNKND